MTLVINVRARHVLYCSFVQFSCCSLKKKVLLVIDVVSENFHRLIFHLQSSALIHINILLF